MRFEKKFVSAELLFEVGLDVDSNDGYLAIPVSNSRVDYSEYYRIDHSLVIGLPESLEELKSIAKQCRRREMDEHLYLKPGSDRGIPREPVLKE